MTGTIARIVARYIAGLMVSYGIMAQGDVAAFMPDLVLLIGALLGVMTETFYAAAKRKGWA